MKILGKETIEDSPENSAALPQHLNSGSKLCDKKEYLTNLAGEVVDQFVLKCHKVEELLKKQQDIEEKQKERELGMTEDGCYKCQYDGCKKTYRFDGKARRDHEASHRIQANTRSEKAVNTSKLPPSSKDDMLDYQSALLEVGLLIQNFYDAISEGDGERVISSWKLELADVTDGHDVSRSRLGPYHMLALS